MAIVSEDEVTEIEGIKLASSVQVGDLGSIIFPAAKALLSWLRHQECIESKYVLGNQRVQHNSSLKTKILIQVNSDSICTTQSSFSELGSGTGLVGLAAGLLGAEVIMTDLPIYIPQIQASIECNKTKFEYKVSAAALDWGENLSDDKFIRRKPDFLLLSDCIYYEQSLEPLVNTIKALTDVRSTVLLSYERRPEKSELYFEFFKLIESEYTNEILFETESPYGNSVFVMKLRKI